MGTCASARIGIKAARFAIVAQWSRLIPEFSTMPASAPAAISAATCGALPNNAVRIHDGAAAVDDCPGCPAGFTAVSGNALKRAITAHEVPAYDRNSSLP